MRLYLSHVRPHLEYACSVCMGSSSDLSKRRQFSCSSRYTMVFILMPDAPVHVRPLPIKFFRNSQQLFSRLTAHTSSFYPSFFQALSPLKQLGSHRLFAKVTLSNFRVIFMLAIILICYFSILALCKNKFKSGT